MIKIFLLYICIQRNYKSNSDGELKYMGYVFLFIEGIGKGFYLIIFLIDYFKFQLYRVIMQGYY